MADALLIGLSALQAHQRSMEVTSHNIANVATPGYSRQRAELGTPIPENTVPGQIGRGVTATAVTQFHDQFLTDQIRKATSEEGRLTQMVTSLGALEGVLSESGDTGLSNAVNNMFTAFQNVASNPESPGMRRAAVEEMSAFTATVNGMADRLADLRDGIGGELTSAANRVNTISSQIAKLNSSIREQVAVGRNPNDLLDSREVLLQELASYMDVKVRFDKVTQVAYVETSGRLLIDSSQAVKIRTGSSQDSLALLFGDSGESMQVNGGKIGAMLELHSQTLPAIQDQIDSIAQTIAFTMNGVHSTGVAPDQPVAYYLSQTVIGDQQLTDNLDAASQIKNKNGTTGVPEPFLPKFTDANGTSIAGNLTINVTNSATGVAQKYVLRYEPGVGNIPANRSLQDVITAINTGSSGGFTLHGPDGVGIPAVNVKATARPVDGGYRLELAASTGYQLDFSKSLETQPSAEARNAATWSVGAPTVAMGGRYSGNLAYNPAQPWNMEVLNGGIVGDSLAPPVVRFSWMEDVNGVGVPRTQDVTLDASYRSGSHLEIGNGVHVQIETGTLVAGDTLELVVDGKPDSMNLLGALGINTLFQGSTAATLKVSSELLKNPTRLATAQTRAVGDNSNVLALVQIQKSNLFENGTANMSAYVASTMAGVGSEAELANRLQENQSVIRQALDNRRDSISGVNLDEEVGLLILQQQAYTAAARIISTAQENIRTLLDIFN